MLILLMVVKYLTLSFFPDVSSSLDEIRKLFTSVSSSHGLIMASSIIYNVLFKEFGVFLGYPRFSHWSSFLANVSGAVSSLMFLLRHDYITYWYDPPFGRLSWMIHQFPNSLLMSLTSTVSSLILSNILWLFFKHEIGGFDSISLVLLITLSDWLLTKLMQNFLAKPCFLDDQNYLGEEVAINGLLLKDTTVHFQCLHDLSRASSSRKAGLLSAKGSQWLILLELCLEYITNVSKHIQSYSSLKMREKGNSYRKVTEGASGALNKFSTWVFFVFNEPFEVMFRNQLFKHFTMAALSSRVLTKFVVSPGMASFMVKDNTLALIMQAQADCLLELEKYKKIDPNICSSHFISTLRRDLTCIRDSYKDYVESLSLSTETLELIFRKI
jgi:hypothetical protein